MKFKQLKIRHSDGSASYEEFCDHEGLIEIAIAAYASGERNPRLQAVIDWVGSLGRMPTSDEFIQWFESMGGKIAPGNGAIEPHEN